MKSRIPIIILALMVVLVSAGCVFNLGKSYDLKVTVTNVNDTPIANATVTVNGTTKRTVLTDQNGVASFTKISGQVTVSVVAEGFVDKSQALKVDANKNITIKLAAKEIKYDLNVTVLKEADNTPIAGAVVTANSASATTNQNGVAILNVLSGQVTVSVAADGFEEQSQTLTLDANKNITFKLAAQTIRTVGSPTELETAISDPAVTLIKLSNNITASCTITRLVNLDLNSYTLTGSLAYNANDTGNLTLSGQGLLKGDLTVNTPNATVVNRIKVEGKVNINAVASNSWYEEATENTLVIAATGINIYIKSGAKEVIINASGNNLHLEASVLNLQANFGVSVLGADFIGTALVNAEGVIFDLPPLSIDEESTGFATIRRPFEPGSGGSIAPRTFDAPLPNTICGFYLHQTHRISVGSNIQNEVAFGFFPPYYYEATSFTLQYSKDSGSNWSNYLIEDTSLQTTDGWQENFYFNPDGSYLYRLKVNGGPFNGYTSNVLTGPLAALNSAFNEWAMDESFWISEVIAPFVGRAIEVEAKAIKLDEKLTDVSDTLSYSWWRFDPYSFKMTEIQGQTSQRYITTEADIGYYIGWRATGDGVNSGGTLQVISRCPTLSPNKAFISDVTPTGFNLNLHKSVSNLPQDMLELSWSSEEDGDMIEVTGVTDLGTGAVFHISAQIPAEAETIYLTFFEEFGLTWIMVSESFGHMCPMLWYDL